MDARADRALAARLIDAQPGPAGGLQPAQPAAGARGPLGRGAAGGRSAAWSRPGHPASLPPHAHALGHEWALDDGHEATVTIAPAAGAGDAAADRQRGDLRAWRPRSSPRTPRPRRAFLAAYAGTGAFWNATTRLLDGFKLLGVPETGINIDQVPGPRGPVTFRDLYLRQYVSPRPRPAGRPGPRAGCAGYPAADPPP